MEARNSPTNADDEFCETHGLFYDFHCPECFSVQEQAVSPAPKKVTRKVKRHCCDQKGECRHSHSTVTYCSICGSCSLCETEKAIGKSDPKRQHSTGTAIVVAQQVRSLYDITAKACGCKRGGNSTPIFCYGHELWFCEDCTNGSSLCPACEATKVVAKTKTGLKACKHLGKSATLCGHAGWCKDHDVFFCTHCHSNCPLCLVKGFREKQTSPVTKPSLPPTGVTLNPENYPLARCQRHGIFCTRCDKTCPECDLKQAIWGMGKCDQHGTKYCIRCGLGCKKCGKREMKVQETEKALETNPLECPSCRSQGVIDCSKHGFYCVFCEGGKCPKCEDESSYSKAGIKYHRVCGKTMALCLTHKTYHCAHCNQRCRLCPKPQHCKCGLPMSFCKPHDEWYCGKCDCDCGLCEIEQAVAVGGKYKHHCGCSMLLCAKHTLYFCPACDYLCSCALNCGLREKYYRPSYDDPQTDLAFQWEDFQIWLSNKNELLNCMSDFQETWDDFIKFLFVSFLNVGNTVAMEEAVEKFMCVEQIYKAMCNIVVQLKGTEIEVEEEPWTDGVENESYEYLGPYSPRPSRVKVTIEEFASDDLAVPK